MTDVRFVAEVRAAEGELLARLPEGELMGRAAGGLAATCLRLLRGGGGCYGARVVLLVGTGNNGGDALFAGAVLARRGAAVTAVLLGDAHAEGLATLRAAGGRTADPEDGVALLLGADLVVDGIVGIGGRGALDPTAARLAVAAVAGGGLRVAVDLPSGVIADTGEVPDPASAFAANVTVTFGARKPAHVLPPALDLCGVVEVVDIGLAPHWAAPAQWRLVGPAEAARWFAPAGPGADKYSRGVVGVIAGSAEYPGAAVLTAGAARYGGAGYVRYSGAAESAVLARWPEIVTAAGRVQAWVIGPGLGTGVGAVDALREVLGSPEPVVIDAEAINVLAGSAEFLDLVRHREAVTVVTPHDRERARLAEPLAVLPSGDRLAEVRQLADALGAVVLAKGQTTLVVGPGGEPGFVVRSGSPALATAGSGDVLSGLLGSALAHAAVEGIEQRRAPELAAAAAWVHGLAGRLAAGPAHAPVSAQDVLAALPLAVAGG